MEWYLILCIVVLSAIFHTVMTAVASASVIRVFDVTDDEGRSGAVILAFLFWPVLLLIALGGKIYFKITENY